MVRADWQEAQLGRERNGAVAVGRVLWWCRILPLFFFFFKMGNTTACFYFNCNDQCGGHGGGDLPR